MRALSDYARLLLEDDHAIAKTQMNPVFVWDAGGGAAEDDQDKVMLATRAGLASKRPRVGDPLVLEVRKGTNKHNAFALGITIGRTDSNDVVVEDESVSRFHAWLQGGDGKTWKVVDAESRNGSWLGPLKLEPNKPHVLEDGKKLRVGDVELIFLLPESFASYVQRRMNDR